MAEKHINWNTGGGFSKEDWDFVYCLIQKYKIKSVLEYGCGLSTELLNLIGMEVLSLETQTQWASPYIQDSQFKILLCNYVLGYPDLPKSFDLGFIDGPGEAEIHDRSKSVIHAKKYCSYLYLHDYNLGQFEPLDIDNNWIKATKDGDHNNNFYIHRRTLID